MKCPNSVFPRIQSAGEPVWSVVMCWDSELEQVDKVLGWKGNGAAFWVIGCARVVSALERNIMGRFRFSEASCWLVSTVSHFPTSKQHSSVKNAVSYAKLESCVCVCVYAYAQRDGRICRWVGCIKNIYIYTHKIYIHKYKKNIYVRGWRKWMSLKVFFPRHWLSFPTPSAGGCRGEEQERSRKGFGSAAGS